jgi:hypothetical protein
MSNQDVLLLVAMAAVVALQIAAFVRDVVRARRATIGVKVDGTRSIVDKPIHFKFVSTGHEEVRKAFAEVSDAAKQCNAELRKAQTDTIHTITSSVCGLGSGRVYDKPLTHINGKLLAQVESVSVYTEHKARADGTTDRVLRARVVSLIPATMFEFDAISALAEKAKIELKLVFGGSGATLMSHGLITYASVVASANSVSRLEFEFVGEPSVFVNMNKPEIEPKQP